MTSNENGGIARERYYGDSAGQVVYSDDMNEEKITEAIVGDNTVITVDTLPDGLPDYLAEHDAFADGPDAL